MMLQALLLLVPMATTAFMQLNPMPQNPFLNDIVAAQDNQRLQINLDIGKEGASSRLAIKGMVFDLDKKEATGHHVQMPGKNGPHPNLSTGIRSLKRVKDGEFVTQMGMQFVKTIKGAWELIWRKDSPAGVLVCGFEIAEDYRRNDASLSKGRVYMSFPIWTKDTLEDAQKEKHRVIQREKELAGAREEALAKSKGTANPIMKALHLRNAYAAMERINLQPDMQHIPASDEVLSMQDGLLITAKGLVWSKSLPRGPQILLGSANLVPVVPVLE